MWLCPGRGTCGTAHPQGSPKIPSCQPSACQHVQVPGLSVEAALAPTLPRTNLDTVLQGLPSQKAK